MSRYEFDHEQPYIVIEKHEAGLGPLLIGLAIGAGVALLFAPRSGAETRQDIKRRASRVRRAAEDAATDVADSVADTFHDARRRVEDQIDAVRESIDLKRQQVNRAVRAGRLAADEARAELEARIAERKAAHAGANVPRSRQPATADTSDEG